MALYWETYMQKINCPGVLMRYITIKINDLSPTFFKMIIWTLQRVSTNEIRLWLDDKILMQKSHKTIDDHQFLCLFFFYKIKFDWNYLHKILYEADNGILECVSVAWYNSASFCHPIVSFERNLFTPETFLQVPSETKQKFWKAKNDSHVNGWYGNIVNCSHSTSWKRMWLSFMIQLYLISSKEKTALLFNGRPALQLT